MISIVIVYYNDNNTDHKNNSHFMYVHLNKKLHQLKQGFEVDINAEIYPCMIDRSQL